jgi:hypothetical protein
LDKVLSYRGRRRRKKKKKNENKGSTTGLLQNA